MKVGDLVRIAAPPHICWELAGKVGIVVEYFPPIEQSWLPFKGIAVVLVENQKAFFYEDELYIINKEE